jgi:hypothetical protein
MLDYIESRTAVGVVRQRHTWSFIVSVSHVRMVSIKPKSVPLMRPSSEDC